MSAILDAIRQEREQLLAPIQDKLTKLDELEALASGLDGNGTAAGDPPDQPAPPPAAPAISAPPPAPQAGTGGRSTEKPAPATRPRPQGESASRILEELRPGGKTGPELMELIGLSSSSFYVTIAKLLKQGRIVKAGGKGGVYTIAHAAATATAPQPSNRVLKELKREDRAPALNGNGRQEPTLEGRILGDLAYLPNTPAGVAHRLTLDPAEVARWMRKLETDGEISKRPDGAYAVRVQGGGADIVGNPRDSIIQIVAKIGGWVTKTELAYQLRRRGIEIPNVDELLDELQVAGRISLRENQVSVDALGARA